MKKLFVVLVALSALYITGCKSDAGDPKAVLISFFDAMSKKDFPAARKLATADSKGMFDIMEMGMKMADNTMDDKTKEQFDKNNMEIGAAKIDGDRATVNVKEKKKGNAVDFVLKKEDGSWKVAMDMNTLMEMGSEKMKEEGMTAEQEAELKAEMEKFKNMNPDSLKIIMEKSKEAMEKGMKMLDSINDKMKK